MADAQVVDKYAKFTGKVEDMDTYVHQAYEKQIDWYWSASSVNKKSYKRYRFWTIVLGALVTLIASLSTTKLISSNEIVGSSSQFDETNSEFFLTQLLLSLAV